MKVQILVFTVNLIFSRVKLSAKNEKKLTSLLSKLSFQPETLPKKEEKASKKEKKVPKKSR